MIGKNETRLEAHVRRRTRSLLFAALALLFAAVGEGTAFAGEAREQVTLSVEGMVCPLCENTVESVLTGIDGVDEAHADRTTESAVVVYNPQDVSPGALAKSINEETYYKATLASAFSQDPLDSEADSGIPTYVWLFGATLLMVTLLALLRLRRRATGVSPDPDGGSEAS